MKIIFLVDFCGRETAMQEYKKGQTADLPWAQARELVRLKVAEMAHQPPPFPPVVDVDQSKKKVKK